MPAELRLAAQRFGLPGLLVVAMSIGSSLAFRGAFTSWGFLVFAAVGAIGAAAVSVVASWQRVLIGEAIVASILGFVLVGIALSLGPVPFFDGLVNGWADILSVSPPADMTREFAVLPFTIGWLGSLIGCELLRSLRIPGIAAIGPIIVLCVALLFSSENKSLAVAQGAGLAASTVLLGLIQQRLLAGADEDLTTGTLHRRRRRGLASSAALIVAVTALAPLVGPRLPLATANDRFDLRDLQEPPFDPLSIASPLVQLKANLKEGRKDDVVFSITGESPVDRVPVAVHGAFDGVVWTVAESLQPGAGEYLSVGSTFPAEVRPVGAGWSPAQYQIEIGALGSNFLPLPGYPTRLVTSSETEPRFNQATGNVVFEQRLQPGFAYTVDVERPPSLTLADLRASTFSEEDRDVELGTLPPTVRSLAADLVEGRDFGWPQIEAISEQFTSTGFYDATSDSRPGHSYFRLSEFLEDQERIVGYEEQYAAAAAVIARIARVPSRVVVGYEIDQAQWRDGRAEVLAGDISAWIEVRTDQHGWIPVVVAPDRTREPSDEDLGVTIKNVAVPNPPPPPPPPPDLKPPTEEEEEEIEEDEDENENEDDEQDDTNVAAIGLGVAATSPLWVAGLGALGVVAVKRRRTMIRRNRGGAEARVRGAWLDMTDRYREAGLRRPKTATQRELAYAFAAVDGSAAKSEDTLLALADVVDRASFHPGGAAEDDAVLAWSLSDDVVRQMRSERSLLQRIRMRVDPRPLRNGSSRRSEKGTRNAG